MLSVANRPLMEHTINLLRRHGFTDVIATVQFMSSVIRNYFDDGSDLGVSMGYATEEVPLGTAGSVLGARDLLTGRFVVISGDALTDLDLSEVVQWHEKKGAAATIVLKRMEDPLEFGIVMTHEDGRIQRFLEKPTWGQVFSDTINTGIYVLEPEVLELIPPEQPYDFSSELFPAMLDKGLPLFGFVSDAYWTDVGNSDAYLQANHDVLAGRVGIDLPGFELQSKVWVGQDVEIHPTARLRGPVLLGDNITIGAGATVGENAVIGSNALIGDDARVQGVVMERAHVGNYAQVRGGVLGRGAALHKGATLEEGAVAGDDVVIGGGAIVRPRVRIFPSRTVESGAIVTTSVVRERRATRSLFGARGVSGLVNLAVTPLVAVRLGMAFGTTLKRGSVVVTGRDASRAARTMKRAIIAGLNSSGVNCHDLELVPMPLTRFTVRSEQASAGVGVRTSPGDPDTVEIRLFDSGGADVAPSAQRKIERIFFREDYRRASAAKIGELEFPPRALEQYSSGLVAALDLEAIRSANLKLVVDYAYGADSLIGPSVMGRLGCDVLALHAFADEHRPVLSAEDLESLLRDLASHVTNSGSDLGILIEPGGEVAHLVDDRGRAVSLEQTLLMFIAHEASRGARRVAVPVSVTHHAKEVARRQGAELTWTTTSLAALMDAATAEGVGFAGNAEGAHLFPEFLPAPDGLMTMCKVLEVLATTKQPLSSIVEELPEVHMARRDVPAPWTQKGAVMRRLSASAAGRVQLLDGVKVVEDDRWALVIPLPDEPVCRIWAEAPSDAEADALAERYVAIVRSAVEGDAPPAEGRSDEATS
jgi:mannose-1-phosphate guanylyltransferase/phosphomannomutase